MTQPLWRQVQHELEGRIRERRFEPGAKLPTEEQLAEEFGVHRHTIRRAVEQLNEKELVRVEQGRGIFVREQVLSYRVGRNTKLSTAARNQDRKLGYQILSIARAEANRACARALALPDEHPVVRIDMLRVLDERPITTISSFYPLPRFEGIERLIADSGSIGSSLKQFGVEEFSRRSLRVRAVLPNAREARQLSIERNTPLLELTHIALDLNGVPVEHSVSRSIGTGFDLRIEF